MNIEEIDYLYTKCVFIYLIKNDILLIILTILDYTSIHCFITLCTRKMMGVHGYYNEENTYIYYSSPYNYYKSYIPTKNTYYIIGFSVFIIVILALYYIVRRLLTKEFISSRSTNAILFKNFFVNFYEFFIFRFLSTYIIDCFITCLIKIIYETYDENNSKLTKILYIFLCCILVLIILLLIKIIIQHYEENTAILTLKKYKGSIGDYPFESNFSYIYDLVTLIVRILIILERNMLIFGEYIISYRVFVINLLGFIFILCYFFYILYLFCFSSSFLLYFPINILSLIKNSLLGFSLISPIINVIIDDDKNFEFYLFDFIGLGMFLYFFLVFGRKIIKNNFYKSKNLIPILIFLISNNVDNNLEINYWIIYHVINCKDVDCLICQNKLKIFDIELIKNTPFSINKSETFISNSHKNEKSNNKFKNLDILPNFFVLMYDILLIQIKKGIVIPNEKEKIFLDIIELYYHEYKGESQKMIFYLSLYNIIEKYKHLNKNVYYNILIMYDKIIDDSKEFYKIFNEFNSNEKVTNIFIDFFKDINTFMRYKNKNPENIISMSYKFYKFAHDNDIWDLIKKNKNSFNYESLHLRYIFENIVGRGIKKDNYEYLDLTIYEDYINFHFEKDSFLLLKYGLISREFIIVRTSFDFKNFKNKNLTDLFPKKLRECGRNIFREMVRENNFQDENNKFNFVINDLNSNEGLIKNFQMKFIILPNIIQSEILIDGTYEIIKKEVLVFKNTKNSQNDFNNINDNEYIKKKITFGKDTNFNNNISELCFFSSKFKDIITFTPKQILKLKLSEKIFNYNNMFTDKQQNYNILEYNNGKDKIKEKRKFKESNIIINSNDYDEDNLYLNYSKLYTLLKEKKSILKTPKLLDSFYSNRKNIMNFGFTLKIMQNLTINDEISYVIYSLTIKRFFKNSVFNSELLLSTQSHKNSKKPSLTNIINDTASMNSVASQFNLEKKIENQLKKSVKQNEKKDFQKLNTINIIKIIVNISIITFTIILLILLINKNNKTKKIFDLYYKYTYFSRGIETQVSRLFGNICVYYYKNSTKCTNLYKEYSDKYLIENLDYNGEITIYFLVYNFFINSYSNIQDIFSDFRLDLYSLSHDYINKIEKIMITMIITEEIKTNNNSTIIKKENFLEAISLFMNYFTQIINNNDLYLTPIKMFNFDENLKIEGINLFNCTNEQRNIYSIILNYIFIMKGKKEVKNLINNLFIENINSINLLVYILIFSSLIFHSLLIYIIILFIHDFIIIINNKVDNLIDNLTSETFMKYFSHKIKNCQIILNLYEKNSIDLIFEQKKEKEEYIKIRINEKKDDFSIPIKIIEKRKKQGLKNFSNFKKENISKIIIIYIIYFIIVFASFFIINYMKNNIVTSNNYLNYNNNLDENLLVTFNLIQIMIYANMTEVEFGLILKQDRNYNILKEMIDEQIYYIKLINEVENKPETKYAATFIYSDFDCSTLDNLDDEEIDYIISNQDNFYTKEIIYEYLEIICNYYEIFDKNDMTSLMNNLLYTYTLLYQTIKKVDYDSNLNQLNIKHFYDSYTIQVVFIRILRNHFNDKIFPNLSKKILSNFQISFILCLLILIFFQIFMYIFIENFITNRMLVINNRMGLFAYFLE